ncbi:MAG: ribonuclease HII [bacterium]|nr:ribonuclease HII [bacterium]
MASRKNRYNKVESTQDIELALFSQGIHPVCGIDEAGRGAIAGPLVAAAVVLPIRCNIPLVDSKKLSPKEREVTACKIREVAIDIGLGIVQPSEIDVNGLSWANKEAFKRAFLDLDVEVKGVITDALGLDVDVFQLNIVDGDEICASVSAASIIAKVSRDSIMNYYDRLFPQYDFSHNKGYPTPSHKERLKIYKPSVIHRVSFSPVKEVLEYEE